MILCVRKRKPFGPSISKGQYSQCSSSRIRHLFCILHPYLWFLLTQWIPFSRFYVPAFLHSMPFRSVPFLCRCECEPNDLTLAETREPRPSHTQTHSHPHRHRHGHRHQHWHRHRHILHLSDTWPWLTCAAIAHQCSSIFPAHHRYIFPKRITYIIMFIIISIHSINIHFNMHSFIHEISSMSSK